LSYYMDVILLTILEDSLQISKFTWSDVGTKPWGGFLPIQCPICGWTDSWCSAYVRAVIDKVYTFKCKNTTCVQTYHFTQPLGATMLLPGRKLGCSWMDIPLKLLLT
ncbi:hypothetical protein P692DRAFT_20735435, partial [Suillus brevipes Sb2]